MDDDTATISISYDPVRVVGCFENENPQLRSSIWDRLSAKAISEISDARSTATLIEVPWPDALDFIREFGSKETQKQFNFRFRPDETAKEKIQQFAEDYRRARSYRDSLVSEINDLEIETRLVERGFTRRQLKSFQIRDLSRLLTLPHGANFSVPGAGKTTVTLALNILTRAQGQHLLVICPKAAFPAWRKIVSECMSDDAPENGAEPFTILDGSEVENSRSMYSGSTRFVMSYDLMVRQQGLIASYLASNPCHLVLDESHRMKAGLASQRGTFLINIAGLPIRRDILTGTPMPQSASDMVSQLKFLWPGSGFDLQIQRGTPPREVLGNLFVRTTKQELGLPRPHRHFHQVQMSPAQLAVYSVVRDETLRQLMTMLRGRQRSPDYLSARKSVMRLLQLSSNPALALQSMVGDDYNVGSGMIDAVIDEGVSEKISAVCNHVRALAKEGRKAVIWTIFTGTIYDLESELANLNPVSIFGAIPSGDEDDVGTREGRLKIFHEDPRCGVLIANPAAAGEGISLHTVCHDAIYLDRSYVSTHYLQSIDRIHRLGLPPATETNIHIYQSLAPPTVGSIDSSVSRRLATKIRNLQQLLDDPDLHEVALDEEESEDPIDYNVDLQDLVDLVEEFEGHGAEASEDIT